VINIKNDDNKCFKWCILAHLHPVKKNAERVWHYKPHENELKDDGITYPMQISDIDKFEKMNNLKINVFQYDEKEGILPLRCKHIENPINLLYLKEGEKSHYCLIKNFSRLMGDQNKHKGKRHYCIRCLINFNTQEKLDEHHKYCSEYGFQKAVLPEKGKNTIAFNKFSNKLKCPFVIYADFESALEDVQQQKPINDEGIQTLKYQHHKAIAFCYQVVCIDPKYTKKPKLYIGNDAAEQFIKEIKKEKKWINEIKKTVAPMEITKEEEQEFQKAKKCHICEKDFDEDDEKVRDHCHITGKYRGAAHNECNLNFKYKSDIPVIIHNLKGYDSHLILSSYKPGMNPKTGKAEYINCIPLNWEKFLTFSIG